MRDLQPARKSDDPSAWLVHYSNSNLATASVALARRRILVGVTVDLDKVSGKKAGVGVCRESN